MKETLFPRGPQELLFLVRRGREGEGRADGPERRDCQIFLCWDGLDVVLIQSSSCNYSFLKENVS